MAFDTDSQAALAALIDYAKQAGADASEAIFEVELFDQRLTEVSVVVDNEDGRFA